MISKYKLIALSLTLFLTSNCGDNEENTPQNQEQTPQKSEQQVYQPIELEKPKQTNSADVEFVIAARDGDFRKARALLDQEKVTLLSADQNGTTALMAAARTGQEDILDLLLDRIKKGDAVRLDLGDKEGNTALMYAVLGKQPDVITILREHGANPNVFNKNREFPIHVTVKNNDFKSATSLTEEISGASNTNLNAGNIDGKTPLHVAVDKNNKAFTRFLKDAGADVNAVDLQQRTVLSQAIKSNNPELIDVIISLGADINHVNDYGETALSIAIENKNYDLAKKLLSKNANPNVSKDNSPTALQIAVSQESTDIGLVKKLIEAGAKLDNNVLARSFVKNNAKVVKLLVDSGANLALLEKANSNGLITALEIEDKELAQLALNQGAELNKLNSDGYSPLALALKNGYDDLAIAMIDKKASLGLKTHNQGALPFEIIFQNENTKVLDYTIKKNLYSNSTQIILRAIAENKPKILETVLANGANPNITDTTGQPAIWLATAQSHLDMIQMLHKAGANIEITDKNKLATPLLISIVAKNRPIMEYYLANGANPNAQDSKGLGALAYAILTKQINLIEPLLKAGANTDIKDVNGYDLNSVLEQSGLSGSDKQKVTSLLEKY